jgi:mRNA interferase MazF
MQIERGNLYWVTFPRRDPKGVEIEKTRPCVIISATAVNFVRRSVIIVPLSTSAKSAPPLAISIPSAGENSTAVCDQIQVIDKRRLGDKIGNISSKDMRNIEQSLRAILTL